MKTVLMSTAATLCFLIIQPSNLPARTWLIKSDGTGDAPTIRAGVDSAVAGDTVLVGPCRYTDSHGAAIEGQPKAVNLHLYKELCVIAEASPDSSVIDYTNSDHAVFIENTHTVLLRGFDVYLTPPYWQYTVGDAIGSK